MYRETVLYSRKEWREKELADTVFCKFYFSFISHVQSRSDVLTCFCDLIWSLKDQEGLHFRVYISLKIFVALQD